MKILLLGGTGEALAMARALHEAGHSVIYSMAGRGRQPVLTCSVRTGGFGGVDGLAEYLHRKAIALLIDATHPYAARISANAAAAAARAGVAIWAYRRPPWQPEPGARWYRVPDWPAAQRAIAYYRRPFITLGGSLLDMPAEIPPGQRWLVRALPSERLALRPELTVIGATGPFGLAEELALLREHEIDVLVCKNSGGTAVAAKLEAARRLGLPVVMLERPPLPRLPREYTRPDDLLDAIAQEAPA